MNKTSILLVDDHPIFVEGLRRILEEEADLTVIGRTDNGADAVEQARSLQPDIAILDLGLKDGSGLDTLPQMLEARAETRIIVLTGYGPENVLPALRRGARGFVSKDMGFSELLRAIRAVIRGEIWADPRVTAQLVVELQQKRQPQAEDALTPRERDVLRLVGEGKRNFEIARALGISENTVKTHVTSMMRKLAIDDRLQLTLFAARSTASRQ
jgi:DNA-binding NarL/FixJ family response regulator